MQTLLEAPADSNCCTICGLRFHNWHYGGGSGVVFKRQSLNPVLAQICPLMKSPWRQCCDNPSALQPRQLPQQLQMLH